MTADLLMRECNRRNLVLFEDGGRLRIRGDADALNPEFLASVRAHRDELLAMISAVEDGRNVAHSAAESVPLAHSESGQCAAANPVELVGSAELAHLAHYDSLRREEYTHAHENLCERGQGPSEGGEIGSRVHGAYLLSGSVPGEPRVPERDFGTSDEPVGQGGATLGITSKGRMVELPWEPSEGSQDGLKWVTAPGWPGWKRIGQSGMSISRPPVPWRCSRAEIGWCLRPERWWRSIHGKVFCRRCVTPVSPEVVAAEGDWTMDPNGPGEPLP
jgi:hypothetical protein